MVPSADGHEFSTFFSSNAETVRCADQSLPSQQACGTSIASAHETAGTALVAFGTNSNFVMRNAVFESNDGASA